MKNNNARIFEDRNLHHRCVRALLEKGYEVDIIADDSEDKKEEEKEIGYWQAKKQEHEFYGGNPLTLLGVVAMWEHLGDDWRKKYPNNPCDEILDKFYDE